eukprot:gene4840-21167_t
MAKKNVPALEAMTTELAEIVWTRWWSCFHFRAHYLDYASNFWVGIFVIDVKNLDHRGHITAEDVVIVFAKWITTVHGRINNCVGEDNVANFIQFLFYAALMSWSTLLMCLAYFLDWLPECAVCNSDSNERFSIHVEIICLTIISVAFAAFTSFMFVDRMLLVAADVTTLELMNDRQAIKKSFLNDRKPTFYKLLSRSFGTSNVVDWFMPYAKRQIRPSYEYNAYNWLEHV